MTGCKLKISRGFTLVSKKDFQRVARYRWSLNGNGAAFRAVGGKSVYLSRFILGVVDPLILVDHVNGDRLDNRRGNLRACTKRQNQCNQKKRFGTFSKFKGAYFDKRRGHWYSQISVNFKVVRLGRFSSEAKAAEAFKIAAHRYHGEFARV
jgi:hypothetical protein